MPRFFRFFLSLPLTADSISLPKWVWSLLIFTSCQIFQPRLPLWTPQSEEQPLPYQAVFSPTRENITLPQQPSALYRRSDHATAILIHATHDLSLEEFLEKSWIHQWNAHLLIDTKGSVYGEAFPANTIYATAPGIDAHAIHIVLEGSPRKIRSNKKQWESTQSLLRTLTRNLEIPLSNHDIASRRGIFTHNQSKKRFGGFIEIQERGDEDLLRGILQSMGGEYFPEHEWKDRYERTWILRKENANAIKRKFQPDRGRGITDTPIVELQNLEKTEAGLAIESRRVRYEHRGRIHPTCVVLHYTATSTYQVALSTLEARSLTATIMVDVDGKAYQLLDDLFEFPSTAFGTNDHCVQIEIIGKDTTALMSNEVQTQKVVALVQELSRKFSFPLNNHKIESFRGVFSHTQAKKKFGGSIFLTAPDFDPGEPYMQRVLEMAGGTYHPEPDWYERKSLFWAILDREFQP